MANLIKRAGIKKGDRVCIYLPMIPELAISVLACARIGAIHSVVFAGFSSQALATRIQDSDCKMIITSDGSFRGAKTIDLKGIVDEALENCPTIESCLVAKRIKSEILMKEGRDFWLQPLLLIEIVDPKDKDEDEVLVAKLGGSTAGDGTEEEEDIN